MLDCQWIQQLHTFGLLSAAFRPDDEVCVLRGYLRQRAMLVTYAAHHIQHVQKALEQMNVKLAQVVSDVTGVTGLRIIRAILDGERDPRALARLRDRRCQRDEETIARSLEGNWRPEHLFALRQAVELLDVYQQQLGACDREIAAYLGRFADKTGGQTLPAKPRTTAPHRTAPAFDVRGHLYRLTGVDLTRIDGIDAHTALKVVAETGLDMTRWPTEKHFASWLSLTPGTKVSGGKKLSGRTKPPASRAAAALRLAARSLYQPLSARRLLPPAEGPPRRPESHHRHRAQTRALDLPHDPVRHRIRRPRSGVLRAALPHARRVHSHAPGARTPLYAHQDDGRLTGAHRSLTSPWG